MKKQLIAAGLTAALVLGTSPAAFAADETAPIGDGTTIKVMTSIDNIDVTVPLALVVTGPVTGGGLTNVPDNYRIVNNSEKFGVKVTQVKGKAETGWTISKSPLTSKSAIAGDIGDIHLQLMTSGETDQNKVATLSDIDASTVNWAIPAHSKAGDDPVTGELGIDIVMDKAFGADYKGSSIAVQKSISATASSAVKVIYTVEIDEGVTP